MCQSSIVHPRLLMRFTPRSPLFLWNSTSKSAISVIKGQRPWTGAALLKSRRWKGCANAITNRYQWNQRRIHLKYNEWCGFTSVFFKQIANVILLSNIQIVIGNEKTMQAYKKHCNRRRSNNVHKVRFDYLLRRPTRLFRLQSCPAEALR